MAEHPVGPAAETPATNPPVVATVLDRLPLSSELTMRPSSSSAGLAATAVPSPPSSWSAVLPGSPTTSLQASNAERLRQEVFEKEQRLRELDAKLQEERWRQMESERLRALEQKQRRLAEEHKRQCEQREAERQQRRELELQRQEAERIEDQEAVCKVQEAAAQRQLLRQALQQEFQEAEHAARLERERFGAAQRRVAELLQRKRRGADPRRLRAAKEEQRALVKHQGQGLAEQSLRTTGAPLQAVPRAQQREPPRMLGPAIAAAPAVGQRAPDCHEAVPLVQPEQLVPPQRAEPATDMVGAADAAAALPLQQQQSQPEPPDQSPPQVKAEVEAHGPFALLAPLALAVPSSVMEEAAPAGLEAEPAECHALPPHAEEAEPAECHALPPHAEEEWPALRQIPVTAAGDEAVLAPSFEKQERTGESPTVVQRKLDEDFATQEEAKLGSQEVPQVVLAQSPKRQESAEESPSVVQRKLDEDFAAQEEPKNQEAPQVPFHRPPQEEASPFQGAAHDAAWLQTEGSPLSGQSPMLHSAASPTLQCRGTSDGTSLGLASPADRFEAREAEELRRERQEAEARQLEAERAAKGDKKEADAFVVALLSLRKRYKDSDLAGLVTCLQTLRVYIKNLASNPLDRKFQRISCENGAFRSRVAPYEGAVAVLEACGFQSSGANLVVDDSFTKTKGPKLWDALSKLDVLLGQLKAAA